MVQTDVERLFLQALMTRRIVSEDFANDLWDKSFRAVQKVQPNVGKPASLLAFMNGVKASVEPLGLDIKRVHAQDTEKWLYVLVNTNGDEVSQLATTYSAEHIALFKQVMDGIITAPNESYSMKSIDAMAERNNLPATMNVSVGQAQALVKSFISKGWLTEGTGEHKGKVSLGQRTITELQSYIIETYAEEADIQICKQCDGPVFKGFRCPGDNGKCRTKIHKPCFTPLTKLSANLSCWTCKSRWTERNMTVVGEGAIITQTHKPRAARQATEDAEDQDEEMEETPVKKEKKKANGRKQNGKSSQSRRKSVEEEEEEAAESGDQEDEEEDAPMEDNSDDGGAPAPTTLSSRKR